jgi:hypothetical protein
MSDLFPSTWDLLIPNFNIWTFIGVFFILMGIFGFTIWWKLVFIKNARYLPPISLMLGIFLVWGVSIIEDFASSTGGVVIIWGSIITGLIAFILFGDNKKRK